MAYLGPRGTFCEEAALRCTGNNGWELVPYPSIDSVFTAVNKGEMDAGTVPIENSCEGAVNQTLYLLTCDNDLQINGEIILPVKHNLLTRPETKPEFISQILSHYQALAQCRDYLAAHFPATELVDVASTAEAARRAAGSEEPWAAVGTTGAAQAYGLKVLVPCIQDHSNNETRFVVLSRETAACTGKCKTSLLVYVHDRPGALFEVLREFHIREINLTKIESRPARTRLGDYLFFIDIEGHQQDELIRDSINALKIVAAAVNILGSYPVHLSPTTGTVF